jgi:DNA/RNA-binding domain of Phe-tRNA-synthetase-like protein
MKVFIVSDRWKSTYSEARVGILVMRDVSNPQRHKELDKRKAQLEEELRSRYAGYDRAALKAIPTLAAYDAFYKGFRKTYHVQLQLESVVLKGKSISSAAALVEAMFMAELQNQLLTAGHDLDFVQPPVRIDVADGSERYVRLNGQEQELKPGDMMIADTQGVLSSVIYGPDQRTRIRPGTTNVLFTVYAPQGVERQSVIEHLQDLRDNVMVVSAEALAETLAVYGT